MTDRHVLVRADASVEIGIGHVMRCRTLADELVRRGWSATLASRDLPDDLGRAIRASGIEVRDIPTNLAIADEPEWLGTHLGSERHLLVIDHYQIGARWLERARVWASKVVAIDDLADRFLPVDLVLNQNLGAMERRYRALAPAAARTLVGPMFALLRPEFAATRDRRRPRSGRVDRILVFLSGADLRDVTRRSVEAAVASGADVDVVIGAAYPHSSALRRWAADRTTLEIHVNSTAMASLMERADLAIGAPSSASWERAAVGLPSVLIILADNQRETGRLLGECGAALTLGWHESVGIERIERAVSELRDDPDRVRAMSDAAARITDGRGTERVVTEIESLVGSPTDRRLSGPERGASTEAS